MRTLLNNALLATLLGFSTVALADCEMPTGPIIPDGNVASQDELVAAQKAMKGFQEELQEYRKCIDGMLAGLDPEAADVAEQTSALNSNYDKSVDAEAAIAEEFNVAVRAFKARQ